MAGSNGPTEGAPKCEYDQDPASTHKISAKSQVGGVRVENG